MKIKKTQRKRSVVKGALAGLAGGIAGAGAKLAVEAILPPGVPGEIPAPVALVEKAAGHRLEAAEREMARQAVHWVFGALAGAAYGVAVELLPEASTWRGAAFGLALNRFTHSRLLPRMGLEAPVGEQSTQKRQSEWVTHAAYGLVTEAVRRRVRRGLE
jgi:putative membrane protein